MRSRVALVALGGASCPSVSLCVAVDLYGAIYSSTDPTGGPAAWHRMLRRGHHRGWFGVDCPTVHLCVVTGSGFETSTRPASPRSWRHAPEPRTGGPFRQDVTGISCASVHLCVAAATAAEWLVVGHTRTHGRRR